MEAALNKQLPSSIVLFGITTSSKLGLVISSNFLETLSISEYVLTPEMDFGIGFSITRSFILSDIPSLLPKIP